MTLWELLSFTAGGAWPLMGLFIGSHWGSLGLLIGLVAGSVIGVGIFWGTDRAGNWLLWRLEYDPASTPFKRVLSRLYEWLLLLGAMAWIAISIGLAITVMGSLFRLYLPAPGLAPWEVTIADGIVYLARHPPLTVFGTLICCAMLFLLLSLIFDRLLRIQFSAAHSDWERQGRMSGYFWSPPGCRKTSMRERGNLLSNWLSDPPDWLKARASFWRRLGVATFWAALVPAVVVFMFGIPWLLIWSFGFWVVFFLVGIPCFLFLYFISYGEQT